MLIRIRWVEFFWLLDGVFEGVKSVERYPAQFYVASY